MKSSPPTPATVLYYLLPHYPPRPSLEMLRPKWGGGGGKTLGMGAVDGHLVSDFTSLNSVYSLPWLGGAYSPPSRTLMLTLLTSYPH